MNYTKEQVERLLQEHRFEYQRVPLPFGLSTGGGDRSATKDLIFPESLGGKSVLDVGSALGYFCFEAEALGARKVVGYEPKVSRFQQANLLKEIKSSRVEFINADVIEHPPEEPFDYVLLLNVIHHLREPIRALRFLASITRERLIIEFPTLEDPKFRSTVTPQLTTPLDHLPLIGVSSIAGADQTFVFTQEALRRIVADHDSLFTAVDFIPSPMDGRAIMICRK